MSRIGREISRAVRELEGDLGSQTIDWNDGSGWKSYICVPQSSAYTLALSIGGVQPGIDAVFIISRDRFGDNAPETKQQLRANGKRFWIDSVNSSADGIYLRLNCQLPEHRA